MKHFLTLILSILLLSACGESGRMQFEQLQQIDSIAEVNADSAVAMIKTINRDTLSSNDNKYYYDLLKIRTNDKAYIAHTSDSAILSVIYLVVVVIQKLCFGIAVPGYATIVVLMLLLGGLILFCLGIIGEYLSKIYVQVKNRPIYIEKEYFSNFNDEK